MSKQRRGTKINIEELKNLINEGLNIKDLAIKYNCHYTTVLYHIKNNNISYNPEGFFKEVNPSKPPRVYQNLISKEQMSKFLEDGYTVWEIKEASGVSLTPILNYMEKYQLERPKHFFYKGVKRGRPLGWKMTEEQKRVRSERSKGERNIFYGKKHTEETKKKMKENHADFTGDKNPFRNSLNTPEKHEEHKLRCKEIWNNRDESWRKEFAQKLSFAMANSKAFQDIKFHKRHKSGFYESEKCGKVFYRSSWEFRLCCALDKDCNVKSFTLEEKCIPYIKDNGKKSFTRIDFIIDNLKMIEVKPKALIDLQLVKLKAMKDYCDSAGLEFEIWTKKEIEEYERFVSIE
jgi:hypothetical protein